jgi:hypothetical protein
MKKLRAALAALLLLCAGVYTANSQAKPGASNIDTLQHVLETQFHLHPEHIPMMGMVSLFARGTTHGGVRGMRVVTYENIPNELDHDSIAKLVRTHLGSAWSLMVRDHESKGAQDDMVWVQPAGERIRMLVVSLDANDLDLVQMELNPDQLAKWKDEHGG